MVIMIKILVILEMHYCLSLCLACRYLYSQDAANNCDSEVQSALSMMDIVTHAPALVPTVRRQSDECSVVSSSNIDGDDIRELTQIIETLELQHQELTRVSLLLCILHFQIKSN